jgi:hypothetical protein
LPIPFVRFSIHDRCYKTFCYDRIGRHDWISDRVSPVGSVGPGGADGGCLPGCVGTLESPDCVVIKNNRITENCTRRFRLVRDLRQDLTPNQGAIPGFAARLMLTPTRLLSADLSGSGSQLFPDLSDDGRELFLDWSGDGSRLFLDLCRRREAAGARSSDHSDEQWGRVTTRGGTRHAETRWRGRTVGGRTEVGVGRKEAGAPTSYGGVGRIRFGEAGMRQRPGRRDGRGGPCRHPSRA